MPMEPRARRRGIRSANRPLHAPLRKPRRPSPQDGDRRIARRAAGKSACGDGRCRRRIRRALALLSGISAAVLGGAQGRPAGQMDRESSRILPQRFPGARASCRRRARTRPRWAHHRPRARLCRQFGRGPRVLRRALEPLAHAGRALRHRRDPCARARRLHQHAADRRLSRRGQTRIVLHRRAPHRSRGGGAGDRPRRAAPAQRHQAASLSLAARPSLRHGRLCRQSRERAPSRRLAGICRAPRGPRNRAGVSPGSAS